MPLKVLVEVDLDDCWFSDEHIAALTDEDFIETIREDPMAFLEGAKYTFVRSSGDPADA